MYKNKRIGVVIRAFNEEEFLPSVVNMIPAFVDRIYVVNDASTDGTLEIISNLSQQQGRVVTINHTTRKGAGAAAISGIKKALEDDIDMVAILDGDGQMEPSLLARFLDPLVTGTADCTKGNRLSSREHRKEMPTWRFIGNYLLTNLTRIASGYWHISDPQNGYIAISRKILQQIELDKIEKGFAFENDLLVKMNVTGTNIQNIAHPAIYNGQHSKIDYYTFILQTSWVLLKDSLWRIYAKYIMPRTPLLKQANERRNG